MVDIKMDGPIYDRFVSEKNYDETSRACIRETVEKMLTTRSDNHHPGMMLGKIQSGKTRTYLGVIALAFDNGYDVAVVWTKGTNALAKQTVSRLAKEFKDLIDEDQINVADVMAIRQNGLNAFQLESKIIVVCTAVENREDACRGAQQSGDREASWGERERHSQASGA